MAKLIDRCYMVINKLARLPNIEDEKLVCWGLDEFGFQANGKRFFPLLKNAAFPPSEQPVFPPWMIEYMENTVDLLNSSANGHPGYLQFINGYKAEFYRSAAFNFLTSNRSVFRLTDECAEYINDIGISKIRLSDIVFPAKAFSLFFRMDDREFIIMVSKDDYGIRMTGVNTTIDVEVEPAFASHVLPMGHDVFLDKLIRDEKDQWAMHIELSKFKYDLRGSRGFAIIQHQMRAFVLKFLFLYNSRFLEKKQESETIKRAKIGSDTRDISPSPYKVSYVSLGVREREQMTLHREVVSAAIAAGEKRWFKPWWPVVAHIRNIRGVPTLIGSHFAYRRAGKIERKDIQIEQIVTL